MTNKKIDLNKEQNKFNAVAGLLSQNRDNESNIAVGIIAIPKTNKYRITLTLDQNYNDFKYKNNIIIDDIDELINFFKKIKKQQKRKNK